MNDDEFGHEDTTGIIKKSKKTLRKQRNARLTESLRANLIRRKVQIRERNNRILIKEVNNDND